MTTRRENNFDLLRIISCIAVIFIHVSTEYIRWLPAASTAKLQQLQQTRGGVIFLFNTLSRFSVPCFVMLSGAFILGSPYNGDKKFFYRKALKSTMLTTVIFSVLYTVYSMLKAAFGNIYVHDDGIFAVLKPLYYTLTGRPFFHMWYLFMLSGLYFVTPYVIRGTEILKSKGIDLYGKPAWVFLALASISYWTSSHKLGWDIGVQFLYLSYYMVGYAIYRYSKNHKNNIRGLGLIALGAVVGSGQGICRYLTFSNVMDLSWTGIDVFACEGLDPFTVVSSVLIFSGFSLLKIKKSFSALSSYMFLVFLIHAGVWDVMCNTVIRKLSFIRQSVLAIPFCVVIIFFLSLIAAYIYKSLWNRFDTRFNFTEKFFKIFKLAD